MNFIPFDKKHRPTLGTVALILMQFVNGFGDYRHHWEVAVYIKIPGDRRKRGWAAARHVYGETLNPWIYGDVTHYAELEESPGDHLPPPELCLPGVTEAQLGDANVRNSEVIWKYLEDRQG